MRRRVTWVGLTALLVLVATGCHDNDTLQRAGERCLADRHCLSGVCVAGKCAPAPVADADAAPGEVDASAPDSAPSDAADAADAVDAAEVGPAAPTWTVLVYMASDNNLEKNGIEDMKEMMGVSDTPHLNFLVQVDRAESFYELGLGPLEAWTGSKRLHLSNGTVSEIADMGELNMGTSQALSDFIAAGVESFPADRYVLVLWDHGFAWRGFGHDDFDSDSLTMDEIVVGITDGMSAVGLDQFSLLGFDACLMGDLATLRAFAPFTRHLVVSEDLEPSHGWDYRSFELLVDKPDSAPVELGKRIVKDYKKHAKDNDKWLSITLALLDLERLPPVEAAMDALQVAAEEAALEDPASVGRALAEVQSFGRSADPGSDYQMIDLGHFSQLLADEAAGVADAAELVQTALKALVVTQVNGPMTADATGVSIYFPALAEQYEAEFDAQPRMAAWAAFVRRYHEVVAAMGDDPPSFAGEGGGAAEATCGDQGDMESSASLDLETLETVTETYLLVGFVDRQGVRRVIGRVPAALDAAGKVTAAWDQRVLSVRQGSEIDLLFSETTLDGPYAYHEVPLIYAGPAACPCVLPGEPGYFDTDGDGVANCADADMDDDGVRDKDAGTQLDNCPWVQNPDQLDGDGDGVGDACAFEANQPLLECAPDPAAPFGQEQPAIFHVVTHRIQHTTVATALYVKSAGGVSELTPKPGRLYRPMMLVEGADGSWDWQAGPPLPMRPDLPLEFAHKPIAATYLTDEAGIPIVDPEGSLVDAMALYGYSGFFIELGAVNAAGKGDQAAWSGSAAELAECPPEEPQWCADAGHTVDCEGSCYPTSHLTDAMCDDGSDGPNYNCEAYGFDNGACASPDCPGGFGLLRDCKGHCLAVSTQIGDGVCHHGATPAQPNLACTAFAMDGGDCPCGDECSGHGSCVADACECAGGWSGPTCDLAPGCGDGACDPAAGEQCLNCAADCGACPDHCGDGTCQKGIGEDCESCEGDCGPCACGNGTCDPTTERCDTCPADCGACPECGDEMCSLWAPESPFSAGQAESCMTCPGDCGPCQNECCLASDGPAGTWNFGGGCGDQAVAQCVCGLDPTCCELGWPQKCVALAQTGCALDCCEPSCDGKACGSDSCGGLCGVCATNEGCVGGACACLPAVDPDGCLCEANPDGAACADDGNACTDDHCQQGACVHPTVAPGAPCGDPASDACTLADTCDAQGSCISNHQPEGAACPDDGDACSDDVCAAGVCTHPPAAVATPCGAELDSDCQNPGTCDGAGACELKYEPDGTPCSDDGSPCTEDRCVAGACDHPALAAGVACGDATESECDHADTCDGAGACGANLAPEDAACSEDGNVCTADACAGGVCAHVPKPAGGACAVAYDPECQSPPACDAAGLCQVANLADGAPCGADGDACTDDVCGGGACAHPPSAPGTPCGDPSQSACDEPDACDAAGVCRTSHQPDGVACGDDGNDCTDDRCQGGACAHPLRAAGTLCQPQLATDCATPRCDLGGTCQVVAAPDGGACPDDGLECTADVCASGICNHPPLAAGAGCADQNDDACLAPDTCDGAGACQPNDGCAESDCAAHVRRAAPTPLPDGVYPVDPDGPGGAAPIAVYCDMTTDGGGWMKVLQYAIAPYAPTAGGLGDPTTAGVGDLAKLSDAAINAAGAATLAEYRLVSDLTPKRLFVRSSAGFDDTAIAWAFGDAFNNPADACLADDRASCLYAPVSPAGDADWLDTAAWGLSQDDCDRFYVDYMASSVGASARCGVTDDVRCVSAGSTCGGGDPPHETFSLWVRPMPRSCRDLMLLGWAAGDGIYAIDPDGPGPNVAFDAYCDMTTDGGGWTLVAYAAGAALGGHVNAASGAYAPLTRTGSEHVDARDLVGWSREVVVAWTEPLGGLPTGNIGSYDTAVRYRLPNPVAEDLAAAPDEVPADCGDASSWAAVDVACVKGTCDLPQTMWAPTRAQDVCFGEAYGLVGNDAGGSCDRGIPGEPTTAVYLGTSAIQACRGIARGDGVYQTIPDTMALWLR